jgi:hypothetical protein
VAVVIDGTAWLVTYTAPATTFDEAFPDVEKVLETIRIP